jgi:hypothetical protein
VQSFRTMATSHTGGFLNYVFRHMVGLLGRVISPSQGLYLHRTTQHRKTRDKHPCLERDLNPRSQIPTGQDPRLRPHGHCQTNSICFNCDVSDVSILCAECMKDLGICHIVNCIFTVMSIMWTFPSTKNVRTYPLFHI